MIGRVTRKLVKFRIRMIIIEMRIMEVTVIETISSAAMTSDI